MTYMKPPYLTRDNVIDEIVREHYFRFPGTSVTICLLELHNGAYVVGKSMCINPENFDADKGQEFAREDAIRQVYPLLAYAIFEAMNPESARPSIYKEPMILSEDVGHIHWRDGGADLAEAIEILTGEA